MNAGTKDGGKTKEIELNHGHFGLTLLEHHGAGSQLTLLAGSGMARANAAGDRKEGIGSNDRFTHANLEFSMAESCAR
jgi:hypothetical protein